MIFHFVQVKSSKNRKDIEKYDGSQEKNMIHLAERLTKLSNLNVIGYNINWAKIYNPEEGDKEFVAFELIKTKPKDKPGIENLKSKIDDEILSQKTKKLEFLKELQAKAEVEKERMREE